MKDRSLGNAYLAEFQRRKSHYAGNLDASGVELDFEPAPEGDPVSPQEADPSERDQLSEEQEEMGYTSTIYPHQPARTGVDAPFLKPSNENTLRWGGIGTIQFNVGAGVNIDQKTSQLVQVSRQRPTTYRVQVIIDLLDGWTGQNGGWNVVANIGIGVGSANAILKKTYSLGAAPASQTQINDSFDVPAQAIQAFAELTGTTDQAGETTTQVSIFVAPIYA